MRSSSTMISVPSRSTTGRGCGEIERHHRDVLARDVVPDIQLGPVREREDAEALAGVLAGVVEVPELRPLALRIPAMAGDAEGEDALLRARLFLVAPRAAEGRVEAVLLQRLLAAPASSSRRCASREPWSNGLMPVATPSWLMWTMRLRPSSLARASRNAIMSRNFQVVSTCRSGKGSGPGWKALRARCSSTSESLPIE